jgi:hypothetical protein
MTATFTKVFFNFFLISLYKVVFHKGLDRTGKAATMNTADTMIT